MAGDIYRPTELPNRPNPVASEKVPVDNGSTVAGATIQSLVEAGRPAASQAEAEAGTDPRKVMTPLTTRQAYSAMINGLLDENFDAYNDEIVALRDETVTARNQAVPASAAAVSAASTATGAATTSTLQAAIATTKATSATADADRAEAARDASFSAGPIYPTEAAGRAAVSDGQQFTNLSTDGFSIQKRQRVNSGSSTLLTSLPTKTVTDRIGPISTATVAPESGFDFAIQDALGRLGLGLDPTGRLFARLRDDAIVPRNALSESVKAALLEGAVSSVVAPESGWVYAVQDLLGRVGIGLKPDGTTWLALAEDAVFPPAFVEGLTTEVLSGLLPSSDIVCWGDSLTFGLGGSGTSFPSVMASALGRPVANKGISTQTSAQVAARQGGVPILVTVSGNSIPSSGLVSVTAKSVNILTDGSSFVGTSAGFLAGIHGIMSTDGAGNWTFTRDASGSSTPCPPDTQFIPDEAAVYENYTAIVQVGRNDSKTTRAARTASRDNVIAMATRLAPRDKRIIVMADSGSALGPIGSQAHDRMLEFNQELKTSFGTNFVDHRRYLIDFGLVDAGITATAQDLTDMANDVIPESLRAPSDSIHLNATGYTLVGNFMARQIKARGW